MIPSDSELLRRYAHERSEAAFATLVGRHVDLVYAAALRQVRRPHLAQEVAQTVFIELAKRARSLGSVQVLAAWLYTVTRRRAIDMIRSETRRRAHEAPGGDTELSTASATETADWAQTAPVLDEAMQTLSSEERSAILLRYFENKSLREVGLALGVSDDTAQKRVHRALERLRAYFSRRQLALNSAGLAALLSGHAVAAAPAGLATTVTSLAIAQAATSFAALLPALLMSYLSKTLCITAIVLGIGYGIHEQQRASHLASELADLRARQNETDRGHSDRVSALTNEIARLRAESAATAAADASLSDEAKDPAIVEMAAWFERLRALRAHLKDHPELAIPELRLLDEVDWLNSSKSKLDGPESFRRAAADLRSHAENRFGTLAQKALKKFAAAHAGASPASTAELAAWFDPPADPAMLDRWIMLSADAPEVANLRIGSDRVFTQKAFVDEDHDLRRAFSAVSNGAVGLPRPTAKELQILEKVAVAYAAAHPGAQPSSAADLLPYATTPAQKAALQKLISTQSSAK